MEFFKYNNKSSSNIIYINARIVDPETELDIKSGFLITDCDKILHFSEGQPDDLSEFDDCIDCKGNLLIPGLIDVHVHFRDPGDTNKEDIITGTKAAAAGGVTTVVCQPNTVPTISTVDVLNYVLNKGKQEGYVKVESYASVTRDGNGLTDMQSLYDEGAVGFTDDGLPVMNPFLMQQAFKYSAILDVPIAQHAEDLYLSNKGCINYGYASNKLNVFGIPESAESTMISRDIILLEEYNKFAIQDQYNARYHVLHISSVSGVENVILARKKGLNVTCEVTPHHLLLNDSFFFDKKNYISIGKVNPPIRNEETRMFLVESLKNNDIDIIASDHAPHDCHSKKQTLDQAPFGMIGLETMLPLMLSFYHNNIIGIFDLLKKMTINPAKLIKSDAGRISIGAPADLVLIDLNSEYIIDSRYMVSKSKNTPFQNRKVKGKILFTIVDGNMVFYNM
ncbi:MAG: dihydroorotase [Candidatus Xenolissoclinum pacificiensis L6]|uniref:Dihydroorotase n=1 Tax=Candidatus Xenolissoclinum pacificiensis L6 TaxID=1401685 RepID=W2V143_9RICK|nr:MAG: dihydroorotase [Candidatus Xenolissoclinum pacificiensis L6]